VSFGFGLEDGWVWKESVAVMDGDGSQMLRRRMGTETMSDGDGYNLCGNGLIFHYHAGLYSRLKALMTEQSALIVTTRLVFIKLV